MEIKEHKKLIHGWNDKRPNTPEYKAISAVIGEHQPEEIELVHKMGTDKFEVYRNREFIGYLDRDCKFSPTV